MTKLNADRHRRSRTRPSSAARRSTTASGSRSTPAGNAYVLGFSSSTDFPTTPGAFDTTRERRLRRHAHEAEPGRLGARLLDVPRRRRTSTAAAASRSTAPATPTSRAARPRPNFPTTPGRVRHDARRQRRLRHEAQRRRARRSSTRPSIGGTRGRRGQRHRRSTRRATPGSPAARRSTDFPVTADASDPTVQRRSADAFIAELNAAGSALPYSTFLGGSQSEAATDIAPRLGRRPLRHRASRSRMDFPATVGAFDTVFNGDPSIFWGDAFVTKLALTGDTRRRPRRRPCRPRRRCSSPANAASPAAADRASTGATCRARRRTRSRSTTRARSPRRSCATQTVTASIVRAGGLAGRDAVLARPRRQLRRRRRARGRRRAASRRRPPPPPTALTNVDINPSTVAGGDASSGTVIVSVGAPRRRGRLAVEQQPGGRQRAGHA